MGAAVSVKSAAVRLFSLFLCPGVYCKWHHSYWAFHENVYFFTVLDTRLDFGRVCLKREKYVKWNFITAAPTRAVVGAAWMSQTQ